MRTTAKQIERALKYYATKSYKRVLANHKPARMAKGTEAA